METRLPALLARFEPWRSYVRCHGDTSFCGWNHKWRELWVKRLWCSWRGHRWDVSTEYGWRMCGRCRYDEWVEVSDEP